MVKLFFFLRLFGSQCDYLGELKVSFNLQWTNWCWLQFASGSFTPMILSAHRTLNFFLIFFDKAVGLWVPNASFAYYWGFKWNCLVLKNDLCFKKNVFLCVKWSCVCFLYRFFLRFRISSFFIDMTSCFFIRKTNEILETEDKFHWIDFKPRNLSSQSSFSLCFGQKWGISVEFSQFLRKLWCFFLFDNATCTCQWCLKELGFEFWSYFRKKLDKVKSLWVSNAFYARHWSLKVKFLASKFDLYFKKSVSVCW